MKLLSWQQPEAAAWAGTVVSKWYGVPLKGL